MDINVKAFQEAAVDGNFEQFNTDAKPEAVAKDGLAKLLAPVFAKTIENIKAGKLSQAQLTIQSPEPTIVRLETGIINLPLSDAKKVMNFFEAEEMVPVNLYLIVISPDVNASGLRIDMVTDAETFVQGAGAQEDAIIASVQEKLDLIKTNHDMPKPEPKPIPAGKAKTTAKKTTTRKTTARKTTTRKPAAKKPAAKTAAAKKPATKSAAKKTTTRKPAAKKTTRKRTVKPKEA